MAKLDDTKRLNVVIDNELHKKLKMAAAEQETTIGAFVAEAIKEKLEKTNK
jgi:predicted HicB family RNase H-like nuclease